MAETLNITSRRRFLAGSAVASVAIVAPLAIAVAGPTIGEVSAKMKEAHAALAAAHTAHCQADSDIWTARVEMRAWGLENPEPRIADDYEVREGETVSQAFNREQRALWKAMDAWRARHTEASRGRSIAALQAKANSEEQLFCMAAAEFADIPAGNIAELIFKAEAAADFDHTHSWIAAAVTSDLLDLRATKAI